MRDESPKHLVFDRMYPNYVLLKYFFQKPNRKSNKKSIPDEFPFDKLLM